MGLGAAVVGWLGSAAHELAMFAAVGMLAGGLDDLLLDLAWLALGGWRRLSGRAGTTFDGLPPPRRPGHLALFVPAWREAEVIGGMLRTALQRFGKGRYTIFVGTYPNDPATARAVLALGDDRIRLVPGSLPGPTSKAECLNRCWQALLAEERRAGTRFKAVVLHDAEDVVHPLELALFDRLIESADLVQIPVFPLPAQGRGWWRRTIAAVYADEFASAHAKELPVREALGASVPSAGVGCAVARTMLARVAAARGGDPFDADSLTEDYELGLRIAAMGGRTCFRILPAAAGAPPIAVRAHFPEAFDAAVRQKARWITGIALAGWDRLRWQGGPAEWWMRFRDRRAVLAAIVLVAGYLALGLGAAAGLAGAPIKAGVALRLLLWANGALLAWRLLLRAAVVGRIYGWRAAVGAVPRVLPGNLVAVAAAARATWCYVPGRPVRWDKTAHVFPQGLSCD